jgi:hypothetical protein
MSKEIFPFKVGVFGCTECAKRSTITHSSSFHIHPPSLGPRSARSAVGLAWLTSVHQWRTPIFPYANRIQRLVDPPPELIAPLVMLRMPEVDRHRSIPFTSATQLDGFMTFCQGSFLAALFAMVITVEMKQT